MGQLSLRQSVLARLVCVLSLIPAGGGAHAQTAHFTGTTTTLTSNFSSLTGISVDSHGNLFFTATVGQVVTEIPWSGTGYGTPISLGSGFSLRFPSDVVVDGSGNLYIADQGHDLVKKVPYSGGTYGTPVSLGSGFSEPLSIAVDGSGNVFVADSGNGAVKEILAPGYTTVNTLGGGFSFPTGIAVDGNGNVFVADQGANSVQEILAAGGYSTAITLGSGFSSPTTIAVDANEDVFVADQNNNAVKEIPYSTGTYGTPFTVSSGLTTPWGVATDATGDVFVTDSGNNAVKVIQTSANFGSASVNASTPVTQTLTFRIDSIAGGSQLGTPHVLTQGIPGLDFKDAGTGTCTTQGSSHVYGAGDTCTVVVNFTPLQPGKRFGAVDLVNASGAVIATAYIYGTGTGPQVTYLPAIESTLPHGSGFSSPQGVTIDGRGNVFVADQGNNAVKEIPYSAGSYGAPITLGSGFNSPEGIAVDGSGNLYVADHGNQAVKEIPYNGSSYGAPVTLASGYIGLFDVAVDGRGNVFFADNASNKVGAIINGPSGYQTPVTVASGFSQLAGIAVDGNGNLIVTDSNAGTVEEIPNDGGTLGAPVVFSTQLVNPSAVAVDAQGNIFVFDPGLSYLEEISNSGGAPFYTFAGATYYFSGAAGIAVDASGNVVVADTNNNEIKKLDFGDAPSLTFGSTAVGSTSSSQTATILNNGNAALIFPAPTVSGSSNPGVSVGTGVSGANFIEGGSCGPVSYGSSSFTLAPGTSCTETVSFAPVQPGSLTATVDSLDNNLNVTGATQSIRVSGTATVATGSTAQIITFPPPATPVLPFATATLNATSTSGLPVLYTILSGPATIAGSTVTYTGDGIVVIEADQYGNGTYAAATPARQSITVAESANVGATTVTLQQLVTIATSGTLEQIQVLTQGAPNLDFRVASGGTCTLNTMYTAGQTCTVNYTFTALRPGIRLGGIVLTDSSNNLLGTAYISATGTGPQVAFLPGTLSSIPATGLSNLSAVAVDGAGNIFFTEASGTSLNEIPYSSGTYGSPVSVGTGLTSPSAIAIDGLGNLFVVDKATHSVVEFPYNSTSYGGPVTLSSSFTQPLGLAVDASGNLFVADSGSNAVKEILASGGYTTVNSLGSGFSTPAGVAVDASGNVFVADSGNNAVKEILVTSGYTTGNTLGSGFAQPMGIAVDGVGNVFVADTANNAIKEIAAAGGYATVTTLSSGFNQPTSLALDGNANIFVLDHDQTEIKKLDLTQPPSLSFATATTVGSTDSTDGPRTVTVMNQGNASLAFEVPASGKNPNLGADFTLASGTGACPVVSSGGTAQNLAAGSSCTLSITFAPSNIGSLTEQLSLLDNTQNASAPAYATQQSSLSATSTAAAPGKSSVAIAVNSATATYGTTPTALSASIAFPGSSVPTGTVTFTVDSGAAATATCTGTASPLNCTVSYSTATLALGHHSINVSMAADANYGSASGSGILTETAPSDFTLSSNGATTQTVTPGNAATFNFTITPSNGLYPAPVTLAVSGLPAGATYSISPSSIAQSGGTQSIKLTVQTQAAVSQNRTPSWPWKEGGTLALLLLPCCWIRRTGRKLRSLSPALLLLGCAMGIAAIGCSSAKSTQQTASNTSTATYSITLTATSGASQQTSTVVLSIQ